MIYGRGGSVGGAVDTLDEGAIEECADAVAEKSGGFDVYFNAIFNRDVQGAPLAEVPFEHLGTAEVVRRGADGRQPRRLGRLADVLEKLADREAYLEQAFSR